LFFLEHIFGIEPKQLPRRKVPTTMLVIGKAVIDEAARRGVTNIMEHPSRTWGRSFRLSLCLPRLACSGSKPPT
jgi:hypothetical protein